MTIRLFNFLQETFADALNLLRSPEGLKSLYSVSLYRNAAYLMVNSGVSAILSWIVLARLYSAEDARLSVGLKLV